MKSCIYFIQRGFARVVKIIQKKNKLCYLQNLIGAKDVEYFAVHAGYCSFVSPLHIYSKKKEDNIAVELPELYIAKINDCFVVGRSQCIIKNNQLYHEMLSKAETSTNYYIADPCLLQLYRKVVKIINRYVVQTNFTTKAPHIEKAISFLSPYSNNYYHFIYEVLSKFYLIKDVKFDNSTKFLFDDVILQYPTMVQLLQAFIDKSKIVWVRQLDRVNINCLYVLSSPNTIPSCFHNIFNCKYEDMTFDIYSLNYLRDIIFSYFHISDQIHRVGRYFLSRKENPHRQYNENEIIEVAKLHHFSIVEPEKFTIKEQIELFHNATDILAASGAALTNILFCRPGTNIFCIVSNNFKLPIFSTIATMLDLNMVYVIGESNNKEDIQSGFRIDPVIINNLLEKY
jgi:capsular polysaccharide biosynthesis protein